MNLKRTLGIILTLTLFLTILPTNVYAKEESTKEIMLSKYNQICLELEESGNDLCSITGYVPELISDLKPLLTESDYVGILLSDNFCDMFKIIIMELYSIDEEKTEIYEEGLLKVVNNKEESDTLRVYAARYLDREQL